MIYNIIISAILLNFVPTYSSQTLMLDLITYRIVPYQETPVLEFSTSGYGKWSINVKICDNVNGCRVDMPSTIHQEIQQNFENSGVYQVPFINFTKINEFKKVQILFTDNAGLSKTLNFSVNSSYPKSYNLLTTTLSKVIRESSHITVTSNNTLVTHFNNFDFRGLFTKTTHDRVINFNDFKVLNNNIYYPVNGFIQILHGFEATPLTKIGSYYQFDFISENRNGDIVPVLSNYYYDLSTNEMTLNNGINSVPTKNLVLSKTYDKTKANTFIFNFRNVGNHRSSVRVNSTLSLRNQLIGNCLSSMICVQKRDLKNVAYAKSKVIK